MKFETFLKLRLVCLSACFLWLLFGTAVIPLLTVAAFQRVTNSLELAFFPLFAIGLAGCILGAILLAALLRDDLLTLLQITED